MYAALLKYGEEHGHYNVPLRCERIRMSDDSTAHLGAWLATQRRENVSNTLKPERRAKLQKLADEGNTE
jgi:dsDNA-binding SOS-regulon protein